MIERNEKRGQTEWHEIGSNHAISDTKHSIPAKSKSKSPVLVESPPPPSHPSPAERKCASRIALSARGSAEGCDTAGAADAAAVTKAGAKTKEERTPGMEGGGGGAHTKTDTR